MVTQEELEKMSPEEIAELQRKNCPFCKIIKGEIPAKKVYEDDDVLAILDINPASKGHLLVLPKEHVPILPLVKPPVFKKLFATTQLLIKVVKKSLHAAGVTVFIANGAVAGQQSPHFLFHIIPGEKDALPNFMMPKNESLSEEQRSLLDSLKNNLSIMMVNHAKREGRQPKNESPENQNADSTVATMSPEEVMEAKRAHIAKMLQENPDVKELLKNNPEEFKQTIQQNPQVEELFRGVDIDALSKNLNELAQQESEQASQQGSQQETQQVSQQETQQKVQTSATATSQEQNNAPSLSAVKTSPAQEWSDIFLGTDAFAQKEKVFAYFKEKPKAKELFLVDLPKFKELLSMRKDVQPIFEHVNLKKLAEKLKATKTQNADTTTLNTKSQNTGTGSQNANASTSDKGADTNE